MEKFKFSPALLTGDMPLPNGFTLIGPVTTDRFPIGAILLRNDAGLFWLWSGGSLSGCDQDEASRYYYEMNKTNLVPITEYAEAHDLNPDSVRQKCLRGGWKSAVKVGRNWYIDPNEPHIDLRCKSE